jgi:hypothetical protein
MEHSVAKNIRHVPRGLGRRRTVGVARERRRVSLAVIRGHSLLNLAAASVAVPAGLALIVGLLTPVVSAVLAAGGAAILLGLQAPVLRLLNTRMALFEFVVMAAVVVILGPGATSIDAHLFGRREVAIRDEHRPNDL